MKIRLVAILLIISTVCVFASGKKEAQTEEPEQEVEQVEVLPDNAVASINGVLILKDDYDHEIQQERELILMQGGQIDAEKEEEIKTRVLDSMIERELLLQESKRQGIAVTPEDVQAEFDQYKAGFPDEESFQTALEQQGFTQDELMTQIEDYLYITAFISEKIYESVVVTEEDIKTFYDGNPAYFTEPEQVRASHILITFGEESGRTREEALSLAESLKKDLEDGSDFGELASLHSECPSSAQGGDLGLFGRGQMVQEFEEAAFALEPGNISEVVETAFGFHLIKVTEKTAAALVPVESVSEMIESYLKQEGTMNKVTEMLADLRESGNVIVR